MLNVEVRNLGDAVILYCQGQFEKGNETPLLCAALGSFGRDLTVDLREVESIDSAGLGALITLQAAGVYLKLQNPRPAVRELLLNRGLDSLFDIGETDSRETRDRVWHTCHAA